jgi:uncharacterized membrane protein YiaA
MKKISLLVLLTAITVCSFSQVTDEPVKPKLKTDYLKKSRNLKITAWVLFGTGAVINIIGISKVDEPDDSPVGYWVAGSVLMFASIPFTIAGYKNKKKALSVAINTQQLHRLKNSNLCTVSYPALTMKIRL